MNRLLPALAASMMLCAISCNKSPETKETAPQAGAVQLEEIRVEDETADTAAGTYYQGYNKEQMGQWDKKIIRVATLEVEVDNFNTYYTSLLDNVDKWNGYIANENEMLTNERNENNILLKVPVQNFEDAVAKISSSGKLKVKKIGSMDFTSEYVDMRLRLEARKKIRLRYLELLKQSKSMSEVLEVEKEINNIQEQIEAAEGRIDYLSQSSDYSSIHLTYFKTLQPAPLSDPSFAQRILVGLDKGLKWMLELLIAFVSIWPLWLGVAIIIWVVRRVTRLKPVHHRV